MTADHQQVVPPQNKQHGGLDTHDQPLPGASSPGCLIMQDALHQIHQSGSWLFCSLPDEGSRLLLVHAVEAMLSDLGTLSQCGSCTSTERTDPVGAMQM